MSTKPISTLMSDTVLFIVRLFLFILLGNPLSMFFFQLLFPHDAADFAQNRNIFGEKIYAFYECLALKWPFYWARWWMKLENLSNYTVEQQIQYLFKVAFRNQTEVEALKAIPRNFNGVKEFWPAAYEELFFKHGRKFLPLKRRDIKNRDDTPKWYGHFVAEFMMQNVRLSWKALEEMISWAKRSEGVQRTLKQYLASGKINDSQLELLIDSVATEASGGDLQMLGVLLDYIKRYGFSDAQFSRVKEQFPSQFVELVAKESMLYQQTKQIKAFKNTDKDKSAWRKFCKETPMILPEVQKMMSFEQYCIFHNVGRTLDVEAIKAFLSRPDKKLWRAVFVKEKDICSAGEIREFIRSNANWELEYRETFETLKK